MKEYITVKKEASDFFIEKKSKFIGYCSPVQTEDDALSFISRIKQKHKDATHNVHAYILRENNIMRFSDDGEPQGTAGIPVLDTMKKSGVVDTVIVATRYFGGILLGGGGLIRAYSHTATIAIAAAERIRKKEGILMKLTCDYGVYGKLNLLLPENGAVIDDTEFLENVTIKYHLSEHDRQSLDKKIADATNGRVVPVEENRTYFDFPY